MEPLSLLIALGTASLTFLVGLVKWQNNRANRLIEQNHALQQEIRELQASRIAALEAEIAEHSETAELLLRALGKQHNPPD